MEKRSGFKTFIIFLAFIAIAYFAAFKFFISDDVLMRQAQRAASILFNRDIRATSMSLSPLGAFKARNVSVSSRGGFQNGKMGSIESASAQTALLNVFNRKLVLKNLEIDGFDISFGKKSLKNIQISKYESLFRQMINKNAWGRLVENGFEIKNLNISNGNALLKMKNQNIRFRNISIKSNGLDGGSFIDGELSFDIERTDSKTKTHISSTFTYNKREKILQFKNISASSLSLRGNFALKFLQNTAESEYEITIQKSDYQKLEDILGKGLLPNIDKNSKSKEITISNR